MQGLLLHKTAGWHFWRFDIDAQLGNSARWLQYSLHMDGVDVNHRCALSLSMLQKEPESALSIHPERTPECRCHAQWLAMQQSICRLCSLLHKHTHPYTPQQLG